MGLRKDCTGQIYNGNVGSNADKTPIHRFSVYFCALCLLPMEDSSFLLELLFVSKAVGSVQPPKWVYLQQYRRKGYCSRRLDTGFQRREKFSYTLQSLLEISWQLCSEKDKFFATLKKYFEILM